MKSKAARRRHEIVRAAFGKRAPRIGGAAVRNARSKTIFIEHIPDSPTLADHDLNETADDDLNETANSDAENEDSAEDLDLTIGEASVKFDEVIESSGGIDVQADNPISSIKLPDAWRVRHRNVLTNEREGDVVLVLQPFDCLYIEGQVLVSAVVGTCRVFGTALSPGQAPVSIHAIPPCGPFVIEAPGTRIHSVKGHHPSDLPASTSKALLADIASAIGSGEEIACALRICCLGAIANQHQDPHAASAKPPNPIHDNGISRYHPQDLKAGKDAIHALKLLGCRILKEVSKNLTEPMRVPPDWRSMADTLLGGGGGGGGGGGVRVAVVGAKGSGKSTLSRYICNLLLQRHGAVAYLDSDVGQAEFTPPGLISLSVITEPVLGPPHTHLRPPDHAIFYGDVSPEDNPALYLSAVRRAAARYRDLSSAAVARAAGAGAAGAAGAGLPLVVNTCGWVKGLGLELVRDVIAACGVGHVIACHVGNPRKDISLPPPPPGAGGAAGAGAGAGAAGGGRGAVFDASAAASKRALKRRRRGFAAIHGEEAAAAAAEDDDGAAGGGSGGGAAGAAGAAGMAGGDVQWWGPKMRVHAVAPLRLGGPRAGSSMTPADLRARQLLAYFCGAAGAGAGAVVGSAGGSGGAGAAGAAGAGAGAAGAASVGSVIARMEPYAVGLECVGVRFMHGCVAPHLVLDALNGTVVGLCVYGLPAGPSPASGPGPAGGPGPTGPAGGPASAGTGRAASAAAGTAVWGSAAGGAAAAAVGEVPAAAAGVYTAGPVRLLLEDRACECVGLGLVRAVDPARRLLYVLTPAPPAALRRVDAIVRGRHELPAAAYIRSSPGPRQAPGLPAGAVAAAAAAVAAAGGGGGDFADGGGGGGGGGERILAFGGGGGNVKMSGGRDGVRAAAAAAAAAAALGGGSTPYLCGEALAAAAGAGSGAMRSRSNILRRGHTGGGGK